MAPGPEGQSTTGYIRKHNCAVEGLNAACRCAGAVAAQGGAGGDGASGGRQAAAGLRGAQPRPHRLPLGIRDAHARHRHPAPRIRPLRPLQGGPRRRPQGRSHLHRRCAAAPQTWDDITPEVHLVKNRNNAPQCWLAGLGMHRKPSLCPPEGNVMLAAAL